MLDGAEIGEMIYSGLMRSPDRNNKRDTSWLPMVISWLFEPCDSGL